MPADLKAAVSPLGPLRPPCWWSAIWRQRPPISPKSRSPSKHAIFSTFSNKKDGKMEMTKGIITLYYLVQMLPESRKDLARTEVTLSVFRWLTRCRQGLFWDFDFPYSVTSFPLVPWCHSRVNECLLSLLLRQVCAPPRCAILNWTRPTHCLGSEGALS